MRCLRAIRFDASDERVFERAARADEFAVSGAALFAGADPAALAGKRRQAFRNGFLGAETLGFTTFAAVAEIDADAFERAINVFAYRLFAELGAPDLEEARRAARAEAELARDWADRPVNTVLAVERDWGTEGLVERVRIVPAPREKDHARVWGFVPDKAGGDA
jgi:hypothetical protein